MRKVQQGFSVQSKLGSPLQRLGKGHNLATSRSSSALERLFTYEHAGHSMRACKSPPQGPSHPLASTRKAAPSRACSLPPASMRPDLLRPLPPRAMHSRTARRD